MANLTFSDILTESYVHLGLDSADATNISNVTRWANYVQQDICARWPWSFMLGRETVVTVVDKTAGTVSVNSGGTAVTGVSTAFASTDIGSFIQFNGSNDWYKITAVTPTTSLTIGTAYQGTSNLSGGTYIIRKFFYSLSSSADRIIDIRNWNTPVKLVQIDARTLDATVPLMPATGSSYGYVAYGVDSSGNIQITPYPFPSDARLFEIRTTTRPTDSSISIPNKYAHVIAWGTIAVGFAYLRKFTEAAQWNAKFEQKIMEMKREDRRTEDYQPILQSIDNMNTTAWQPLPGQYPII